MRGELPPVGSLSERVGVQKRMETPLPEGGHAVDYVPLGSTWARVRSRSGRFGREGDGRAAVASHGVMLRFRKDIGPGDRVIYRGRALEIVAAEDLNGRRAYLSCLCQETEIVG